MKLLLIKKINSFENKLIQKTILLTSTFSIKIYNQLIFLIDCHDK